MKSANELFGFGAEVLMRLDRIAELLEALVSAADAPPSTRAEQAGDDVPREADAHPSQQQEMRGVSTHVYRTTGAKILAYLLETPQSDVGRLAHSINKAIGCSSGTRRIIVERLRQRGLVKISEHSRGKSPYVRISNRDGAQEHLTQLREEARLAAEEWLR